jgi:hypothetical protein
MAPSPPASRAAPKLAHGSRRKEAGITMRDPIDVRSLAGERDIEPGARTGIPPVPCVIPKPGDKPLLKPATALELWWLGNKIRRCTDTIEAGDL